AYDGLGRVASRADVVTASGTPHPIDQMSYTYDGVGRVLTRAESVTGGVSSTLTYTYDGDGKLTRVAQGSSTVEQYSYDVDGNRLSALVNGTPVPATYSNDQLQTFGSTSYSFDPAGFLTARGGDTFSYGARGELLSATVGGSTVSYSYDAFGRRVSRTDSSGTSQYFYGDPYDPFEITAARDASGVLSTYYDDERGLLFAIQRGGAWYYVATDQIGTPRVVSDATGAVVLTRATDSFGNVVSSSGAFDLPIGFAGGLADPLTKFVRFGLRDYDPQTGRWTARDLQILTGGDPNLYRYASNDPVNAIDPSGLKTSVVIVNFYYKPNVNGLPGFSTGHASITVNGQTYGFYNTGASTGSLLAGNDAVGSVNAEQSSPTRSYALPVTPQEAQAIEQYVGQQRQQKLVYNLYRSNCQDFVRIALQRANLPLPDLGPTPWELEYWMISLTQTGQAYPAR
ncbi:MAG: RHS repeat-associated core domain-containing protein, partial [Chloroflexota bacterium]